MSKKRVETGPTRFDQDWPGLFIRGDQVGIMYVPVLERVCRELPEGLIRRTLSSLLDLMRSTRVRDGEISDRCAHVHTYDHEPVMGEVGQWTGLVDRNGTPVHIGDVLVFDEDEWGSREEFTVGWDEGVLQINGTVADIEEWCTVERKHWEAAT